MGFSGRQQTAANKGAGNGIEQEDVFYLLEVEYLLPTVNVWLTQSAQLVSQILPP
ncbi:MAG: hypothetical protein Q618_VCMC00002G0010 [Varibaculum cambriense DORA_20]|nr:MAG: hypothetical protein Q618_VCMC00002G0010 [Varibaculum cambriense DORA_20]